MVARLRRGCKGSPGPEPGKSPQAKPVGRARPPRALGAQPQPGRNVHPTPDRSDVKCSSFHNSALSGSDKKLLLDVTSVKKKNERQPQKSVVSVAEFVFSPVDDLLCLLPSLEGCNDTLEALRGLRLEPLSCGRLFCHKLYLHTNTSLQLWGLSCQF